jgi:hypothetical protein
MAKLIKVRFHQFGGNDVLRVDRLEQSGPDAGQILVSVRPPASIRSTSR